MRPLRLIEQARMDGVLVVPADLEVTMVNSEHEGTQFHFRYDPDPEAKKRLEDPFEAANAFLDASTSEDLLKVFRRCGPLTNDTFPTRQISLELATTHQLGYRALGAGAISFKKMSIVDRGLRSNTSGIERWASRLPVMQPLWGQPLTLEAHCVDLLEALNLSLFSAKLQSLERLYCKLESCRKPFTRKAGEIRYFCKPEHGTEFHQTKYKKTHKKKIAKRRRDRKKVS